MGIVSPLFLTPPASRSSSPERRALTVRVKHLAAESGLGVSAVTTADVFPELAGLLERHIRAGRIDGLDWFTAERARFSAD
ncbi:MAG TPA: hypothetical protein VKB09_15675, partial [Thermomicrobiales bacterium]|nr:hypothetical protein [Thermomicrobiales bacterium]